MIPVVDPVWPLSWVWEVLMALPLAVRLVALYAGLSGLALPIALFRGTGRPVILGLLAMLGLSLALVGWHAYPIVHAGFVLDLGSGITSYLVAFLGVVCLALLIVAPFALAGVGVGTYLGTPGVNRLRLATVILLRLLAFLLTGIVLMRPSLGWQDQEKTRTQVLIAIDRSRSMTVQDERNKTSRWDLVQEILQSARPALGRLREEQGTEVRFFTFADELRDWDPAKPGQADGPRTDTGTALRQLFDQRDARMGLRGVLLIGDGADNGGVPALGEAARWRGLGARIHTFASGNPGTTTRQNDVAITGIATSPTPFVPLKGKLTVKLTIDARGFENSKARVRLFMERDGEDKEVVGQDVVLPLSTGNEVTLVADAPAVPGEIKIKAVVETPEVDDLPLNNSIETFVTVSKEGISVLLVDRQRAFEPQLICDALSRDPRIRVTPVWVRGGRAVGAGASNLFAVDSQPFDVILLGDITLAQLRALDAAAPAKIEKMVANGAGLLVLGGYVNLGNGDWRGSELEKLLPVDLSKGGQEEFPTRMTPTDDGLRRTPYLFRIEDGPDLAKAWEGLAKLDGFTALALPPEPRRGLVTVLATAGTQQKEPLMVFQNYAGEKDARATSLARVVVFAGDTTYRWVRSEETQRLHQRFWRQMILWLARQEDAGGSIWIRPDVRRLPVRSELGMAVGLRGKGGGQDLRDGTFQVEAIAPDGTKSKVPLLRSPTETRGTLTGLRTPGIWKLTVRGEGKDPSGEVVQGESSARVIVYDEDLELSRPAADPEFLKKLATATGGEALRVEQLADFLNGLAEQSVESSRPLMELRPDWRTTARSPFLVGFFVVFCAVVCAEWGLRRWWGLV